MEKDILSIILPVYNGRKHIERCIKSIFRQTYEKIELIILDDGSTDDSYEVIEKLLKKYPKYTAFRNVRLIHNENMGVARTRNLGISLAKGKYVTFVDQDDFIASGYCEAYMREACLFEEDIIVGGYERVNSKRRIIKRVRLANREFDVFLVMAPWAHIYKRSFLTENDIKFLPSAIGEDVYFNILAYSHTKNIKAIDNIDYKWYYNEESVSNTKQSTINPNVRPDKLLKRIISDVDNKDYLLSDEVEYFMIRYICWYMLFSFKGSTPLDIERMHAKLNRLLYECYPDWKTNPYLLLRKPEGEDIKTYGIVMAYLALDRVGVALPLMSAITGLTGYKK